MREQGLERWRVGLLKMEEGLGGRERGDGDRVGWERKILFVLQFFVSFFEGLEEKGKDYRRVEKT